MVITIDTTKAENATKKAAKSTWSFVKKAGRKSKAGLKAAKEAVKAAQ